MSTTLRVALVMLVVATLGAGSVVLAVDAARWRAEVIGMKATGRLPDIGWLDMLAMMRPGSPHHLEPLRRTPSPFAVIRNPHASRADVAHGRALFERRCAACHGDAAHGQTAPNLVHRRLTVGDSDWALYRTVMAGVPERGMPPAGLAETEAWQVVAYVRSLRFGTSSTLDKDSHGGSALPASVVPASRIERAAEEPWNWLTYSGSYSGWRYSALDQIGAHNVADLKLAWTLQLETTELIEASPLVVDGIMYVVSPPGDVLALDAATGDVLWRYQRAVPDVPTCCGRVNRGVAVLDDRVFVGTLDAYLVALDARTGGKLWETRVADYEEGFSITAAPLAVHGKIITGIAGGEFGIRGFLDAYDASTGERLWRFYTVPEPRQPGSETWGGDSWRTGGGPTWMTGSFDPELGLVYWGVGNPAPDFNGGERPGDNLFTNSVIALDVETGELVWHFQFTPHDERDWDAAQVPILVNREIDGRQRQLILWANRNGFFYVLDRATGEFLHAEAFVAQTWAEGIAPDGRPIPKPGAEVTTGGTLLWPGMAGGANWWPPSFSPRADLLYVPFAEAPSIFVKGADADALEHEAGTPFDGGVALPGAEWKQAGIRALDPDTGGLVWEYLRAPRRSVVGIAGVLTTAGDVVFAGDVNDFVAFDAKSGRELWRTRLGGLIRAAPVTYSLNGAQMVFTPAGNALFVFRL